MTRSLYLILFGLAAISAIYAAAPLPPQATQHVQQAWQLLDYVATDYAGAVSRGQITDQAEYAEQKEFAGVAAQLLRELPPSDSLAQLQAQAAGLVQAVAQKASGDDVARRAHALAAQLLAAYPIPAAPKQAPDLLLGAKLYEQSCQICHGAGGDGRGPDAAKLNPPPIAFNDAARADLRSPLSLFQVITQGVEGTGMTSFAQVYSPEERWALAYYVGTLAYTGESAAGAQAWREHPDLQARLGNLDELSQARVAQLAPVFGETTARAVIGWLRAHPEAVAHAPKGLALARAKLAASLSAYESGRFAEAVQLALSSYLDGVEPDEPRLDVTNHALRSRIELAMGTYRTALSQRQPVASVAGQARLADELLRQAQDVLDEAAESPATAFVGAFIILVREGLEALLIVVAMLAFLNKAGQQRSTRYVHLGWILAIVAGGLTWVLARYAISISGASRELTEGLSSLFAAAVLLLVGLWMHQKSIGGRWQVYLQAKMASSLGRGSAWFLFGLAFISVYRELFETILFYAALWGNGQHLWMLAGMLAAIAALAVITWVLLHTSRRLPLSQFFGASSALVAVLAFVLAGKGVAALQEAGWVGVSLAPIPRIEWLGVYPTWQSAGVQIAVLVLLATGFGLNALRGRRAGDGKGESRP